MIIDAILYRQDPGGGWKVPLSATKHHILLLVAKGTAVYHFESGSIKVRKGEGLFFPEGTKRWAESDPSEPLWIYSAHFRDVSPKDIAGFQPDMIRHFRPDRFDYLKQRFSMMNECWIGKMPYYELISRAILLEILGLVQREISGSMISPSRWNLAQRIQQYIVQHYREPLRLSELAEEVSRSPTYISTVFREVTGRTPVQYMHEVRITAARELLLSGHMSIREISEWLGYCDQTYFNYMYKKIVGHPPSHTLRTGKQADIDDIK